MSDFSCSFSISFQNIVIDLTLILRLGRGNFNIIRSLESKNILKFANISKECVIIVFVLEKTFLHITILIISISTTTINLLVPKKYTDKDNNIIYGF